jgi:uncharacterized membrane protein YhaH (DUF805 family)
MRGFRALKYCFSFSGRFNRANFWMGYGIGFLMIMVPIFAIETTIPDNKIATTIGGLWYIVWLVSMLAVMTKRLHDLDHSGLWLLAFFVVLVAVTVALRGQGQIESVLTGAGIIWLGAMKGKKGANRFGGEPLSSGELPTIGDRELVPQ